MFTTRFAPSPTGRLHLGHAFSAFCAFDAARAAGGRCLLRLEDIDHARCRPEYDAAILEDLEWLGLQWPAAVRRQSLHLEEYAGRLADLRERGLLYRCFRTRREIMAASIAAPHGPEPVYPGPVRPMSQDEEEARVAAGEAYAWRLSIARARASLPRQGDDLAFVDETTGVACVQRVDVSRLGDVVLARKDTPVSYHLCVVHDDGQQGVTHVIRGEDLREATHVHRLLQALFDLPAPVYRFHRLLTGRDGRRLAKRDLSETLAQLRQAGATPHDVRVMTGLS